MMRTVAFTLIILSVFLTLLTFAFVSWARNKLHNKEIPVKTSIAPGNEKARFMTFFAHPDDEVACGGTLFELRDAGHDLVLVCLSKGEAGPTGGLVTQDQLGAARALEMQKVADLLQAEALELLEYPDSGMKNVPVSELKELALELIYKYRPDYVISYDSRVGLYGHPDHVAVSRAMEEVFLENRGEAGFSVKKLYQVTLSPRQIKVALQLSPGFQRNYPVNGPGLPVPDFAVHTTPYFYRIKQMMEAHATQQQVFKDLLPFHEQIPAFIYSRIFDREYFYEVR
jgi:N-acetylglucosamine malate deacetylase 2